MADEVRFAADLYRGTAAAYERYRLPYPAAMIEDLSRSAGASGHGRLLDLACGPGQLAFPLRRWFAEVWAVDQEPDMVEAVRAKAAAAEVPGLRPVVSSAETLSVQPGYFELAVIGNAFHRLDRDLVAGRIFGWLQPGGHLALCWSSQPWTGDQGWQRALSAALDRWKAALGAEHRIPAGWEEAQSRRPNSEVLSHAGFELAGNHEFAIEHRWTLPELAGLIRSTSFLPAAVLGDQAAAFDADLAASLGPHSDNGAFTETVRFVYELARKPD
ncbi:MAG: class I SAM-dependent methyltransferase [Nocardiopsaceae bacterium]|nr:class I SAM-dependent methyltransferase [Nocardiopsaceae bacterium]